MTEQQAREAAETMRRWGWKAEVVEEEGIVKCVQLDAPALDRHNDYLRMYLENGPYCHFQVTDGGSTADDVSTSGAGKGSMSDFFVGNPGGRYIGSTGLWPWESDTGAWHVTWGEPFTDSDLALDALPAACLLLLGIMLAADARCREAATKQAEALGPANVFDAPPSPPFDDDSALSAALVREPEKPKVLCRDCTFCWDGGLCYCPALCVRAACGHIVPRPIWATNPSGNCPHRQKREEPDREE